MISRKYIFTIIGILSALLSVAHVKFLHGNNEIRNYSKSGSPFFFETEKLTFTQKFNFTYPDKIEFRFIRKDFLPDRKISPLPLNSISQAAPFQYIWNSLVVHSKPYLVISPISESETVFTTITGIEDCSEIPPAHEVKSINCSLDAGNDTTICPGSSAQLNASGALSYTWSPAAGLSCMHCANPVATPGSTTTYYVSSPDSTGTSNLIINGDFEYGEGDTTGIFSQYLFDHYNPPSPYVDQGMYIIAHYADELLNEG